MSALKDNTTPAECGQQSKRTTRITKTPRVRVRKPKSVAESVKNNYIEKRQNSTLNTSDSSDSDNCDSLSEECHHTHDDDTKDIESDSCSSPNLKDSRLTENVEVITFDDYGQIGSVIVETATGAILVTGKPHLPEPRKQQNAIDSPQSSREEQTEKAGSSCAEFRDICDRLEMVLLPYWNMDEKR